MEDIHWVQIIIALLIPVCTWAIIFVIRRFIKKWDEADVKRELESKKRDNLLTLLHVKSDCTIQGLKEMNGNTSMKFGQVYDRNYTEKTRDLDFIEKE